MTNIIKLRILQRWFRVCLLSLKLKRLIPDLTKIYYDPHCKGGYFAKQQISNFLSDI